MKPPDGLRRGPANPEKDAGLTGWLEKEPAEKIMARASRNCPKKAAKRLFYSED